MNIFYLWIQKVLKILKEEKFFLHVIDYQEYFLFKTWNKC